MSVALFVLTDGRREYINETIPSALQNLAGDFSYRMIYEDTGDPGVARTLSERWGPYGFDVVSDGRGRQGYDGALAAVWAHLAARPEPFGHVLTLEDDFTFNRPVDVSAMAAVLDANPYLAQMALRRQPWNHDERAAGGIVEQHPEAYTDMEGGGECWLEHRLFWTQNPHLFPRQLLQHGWPAGAHSEGMMGIRLLQDPALRFGFWGTRGSGEWVTHIGEIPAIGALR